MQTFRRWAALFKRSDSGSVEADKWLIAEYYKSLGHLTPQGLETLTEELKARCTFFPTIRECLEIINPPKYSYASPFYQRPGLFHAASPRLAAPASQLGYDG